MADALEITRSYLSELENGKGEISDKVLRRLEELESEDVEKSTSSLRDEPAPYNATVEFQKFFANPENAGVDDLKQVLIELAEQLPTASPMMSRMMLENMAFVITALSSKLSEEIHRPQTGKYKIRNRRNEPFSSEHERAMDRTAEQTREMLAERERQAPSPSSAAHEPSAHKSGQDQGKHVRQEGQQSAQGEAPKSHVGTGGVPKK